MGLSFLMARLKPQLQHKDRKGLQAHKEYKVYKGFRESKGSRVHQ